MNLTVKITLTLIVAMIAATFTGTAVAQDSTIKAPDSEFTLSGLSTLSDNPIFVIPDSLKMNQLLNRCGDPDLDLKTPVIQPDDTLMASMPQVQGEIEDEGIFIPRFRDCKGLKLSETYPGLNKRD